MHINADVRDVIIAYIGGGSLNWAQSFMRDMAADGRIGGEVRLYDIDRAAAERNAVIGNRIAGLSAGRSVRYRAASSAAEALKGADFVIVSILPGSFDDMANDIEIPARYGIRQSVGDTVGPGGMVRAMRAVPAIAEIAHQIGTHCPDAFVCNLTNPMSVLTGALFAAFPGIKAWGECHEVSKLRKIIAHLAGERNGVRCDFRDVSVNVMGINHFTWVDRANVGAKDYLPDYLDFARRHSADGWRATPVDPDDEYGRYFYDRNRVKFDLACKFGIAAAAGDRHLAEFVPSSWYLDNHAEWHFGLTPVDYRKRDRAARLAGANALAEGGALETPSMSDEAIVHEIAALCGLGTIVTNANLPNRGQVNGLPEAAVVETNVLFTGGMFSPLQSGRLPQAVELLVAPHAARQKALTQAIIEGRREDILALFLSDPLAGAIGADRARSMFNEMTAATAHCLPRNLAA